MSEEKKETEDPLSPEKIKQHEPTTVKREMTEEIASPGEAGGNPEEPSEIARKKGMAEGTAAAAETGGEYEHGAAARNK